MFNFDRPDFLLSYVGGAGGRFLIQLIMLSDEVFTWSSDVEQNLDSLPVDVHSKYKLEYAKSKVFPLELKHHHENWKNFEPAPWDLNADFGLTKKFIRHTWMREPIDKVLSFNTKKVSFVNCKDSLHFVLTAAIEKHSFALLYHNPENGEGPGQWYKSSTAGKTKEIIKHQLHAYLAELSRWQTYKDAHGFYEIQLSDFLFSGEDRFIQSYVELCKFYEVGTKIDQSLDLRKHWLNLHDYKLNKDIPTFYDVAYFEFLKEI